jgi:hypothetical protein
MSEVDELVWAGPQGDDLRSPKYELCATLGSCWIDRRRQQSLLTTSPIDQVRGSIGSSVPWSRATPGWPISPTSGPTDFSYTSFVTGASLTDRRMVSFQFVPHRSGSLEMAIWARDGEGLDRRCRTVAWGQYLAICSDAMLRMSAPHAEAGRYACRQRAPKSSSIKWQARPPWCRRRNDHAL